MKLHSCFHPRFSDYVRPLLVAFAMLVVVGNILALSIWGLVDVSVASSIRGILFVSLLVVLARRGEHVHWAYTMLVLVLVFCGSIKVANISWQSATHTLWLYSLALVVMAFGVVRSDVDKAKGLELETGCAIFRCKVVSTSIHGTLVLHDRWLVFYLDGSASKISFACSKIAAIALRKPSLLEEIFFGGCTQLGIQQELSVTYFSGVGARPVARCLSNTLSVPQVDASEPMFKDCPY